MNTHSKACKARKSRNCDHLGGILKTWMGPKYRYSGTISVFLNVSEYGSGEKYEPVEESLLERYSDHYRAPAFCGLSFEKPNHHPYGMRQEDWYAEAVAMIQADLAIQGSVSFWRMYWLNYYVFHRYRNELEDFVDHKRAEQALEIFSDWRDLVDL